MSDPTASVRIAAHKARWKAWAVAQAAFEEALAAAQADFDEAVAEEVTP